MDRRQNNKMLRQCPSGFAQRPPHYAIAVQTAMQNSHKDNVRSSARSWVSVDVKQHSTNAWSEHRSCVKVEVAILGSPSLKSLIVSVDVKQHSTSAWSEHRSCVKVEVAILGSPSLKSLIVSVDVKQHERKKEGRPLKSSGTV